MQVLIVVCCFLFVTSYWKLDSEAKGFVVSSKTNWIKNKTNPLLVSNFVNDSSQELFIKIELSSDSYHQLIDYGSIQNDEIYHIPSPESEDSEFNMKVVIASADGSYTFQKDFPIIVTSEDDFLFIQTDKPFYKPSDKVRIRTLVLDGRDLKPQDNKIKKAFITDPKNAVLAQWLHPASKMGIYDFEFPLSSEPRLGDWEFVVETSYSKKSRKFEVMRYVLPKFSLTVESDPKYLLFSYNVNVSYKACAKYSYNKPVSGDIYFKMPDGTEHNYELDGNGCYTLTLENYEIITFGFRFSHNFNVLVTVVEKETGISMSATHNMAVYKAIFLKYSPYCSDHVKPGIDYHCYVQARFSDKVKAKGVKFSIYERNGVEFGDVISDDDGFIHVTIPAIYKEDFTYHSIRIGPERPYMVADSNKDLYLKRWTSPTSTYLGIVNNCNKHGFLDVERFNLTFSYVTNRSSLDGDVSFRYVVYSDGDPFKVGNFSLTFGNPDHFETESRSSTSDDGVEFHRHKHSREVDLRGVVGTATFLLYTQVGGEVVADTVKFRVQFRPKKQMELTFSHESLQPGKETSLNVKHVGKSICSVSVYDKSLEALSPVEYLDEETIQKHWKVERSESSIQRQKTCDVDDEENNSLAPVWDTRGRPTFTGSKDAFQVEGLTVHSDFELSREFCRPFNLEEEVTPEFFTLTSPTATGSPDPPTHRDFFPESWIWDVFEIEEGSEEKNVTLSLPHTITEWSGNGFCIGSDAGLSLAPKFSIVGFQPFFLSLNLPYSVVKGERAVVPLSIHSYSNSCMKVELNISHSNHLNVLKLKSNEIILCDGVPKVVNLTIGAKKVGEVNLTIEAKSYSMVPNSSTFNEEVDIQDVVTHTILVEPEGKPEEVNQNAFVCAPASGELLLRSPEGEIVKDSMKSYVAVSGDLVASALANLENLLALPTGCGEQIMVKFVPNMYVLDYLKESKLLTEEVERRAVDFLKIGYQRSLQFRHDDGSYSAFGRPDKGGSLWLTAFVVKSLAGAKKYVHVDEENFDESLKFVQSAQLNNGCFPLIGELFQRSLMGHMEHDGMVPSAAYNAYIVASLVEAGLPLDDVSVLKGFECLEKNLLNLSDNSMYDNILLLYAHSLVVDERRSYTDGYNKLLSHLLDQSVDQVYWTLGGEDEAVDVEMTSYVMLSRLRDKRSDMSRLLETANWLSGKRNARGGFYSTQDTVVALDALSTLARRVSNPSNVTVTFTSLKKIPPFVVNSANKLLVQKVDAGNLLGRAVKYSVKGDGCVSIQAGTNLNMLTFGGDQHSISVFNISVGLKQVEATCKQMVLHTCFVYNGEDDSTNMGLLVVHLPTGWLGDRESIHFLFEHLQLNLKNYEIDEKSIKFYFDEITKLETCFHFKIYQDVYIVQTKPARVEIFDYYNLTLSTFVEYVIHQRCPQPRKKKDSLLPPLSRFLRSVPSRCPHLVTSPTAEDVVRACSKKLSHRLRRKEGSDDFHLVSSSSLSTETNETVRLSFDRDCRPAQSFSWEDIIISTDDRMSTTRDERTLKLNADDVVMTTPSDQSSVTSLASDGRSIACDWWLYED